MRPVLPLVLALTLACSAGCAKSEPEATAGEPAAETQPAGHPALNKLNETKQNMAEIEKKRAEEAKSAQDEAAGQDP